MKDLKILRTYKLNERIEITGNRVVRQLIRQIENYIVSSTDTKFSLYRIEKLIEKAIIYSVYEELVRGVLLNNKSELFDFLKKKILDSDTDIFKSINKEIDNLSKEVRNNKHINRLKTLIKKIE